MLALSDYEITVLLLSIKVASISSIITFFPSFIMAYLLATKNFTGKSLIDGLIHLPLVLPPVVIGFFLLIIFGKNGLVGDIFFSTFNIRISFSWIAAMIASSVMGFPLFVRSIRQSISEIDPKIIEAAQTLGANKIKIFKKIIIPLSKNGIIAGFILSFSRSLGEFGATITFAGNIFGETQTLPLAIYSSLQDPDANLIVIRLVGISVFISMAALMISNRLNK
jgi:molybdate transport system permease protein